MINRRRFSALATASALLPGIAARSARAQSWPDRPVRFIVPFAAGGPTDAIARIVGEGLSRVWNQQVVVENRGGAGGNIAFEAAAKSDPDGYTMLMGGLSQAVNRSLYRSLNYDPIADFAPVSFICSFSYFMFAPNTLPVTSAKEFIAYAKQNRLTLASPGTGSAPHLCGELFKSMAGIEMTHVPYRGAGPAMNDLIPGRVHLLFSGGATLENAKAGQVRVLGYSGASRTKIAPDVPTIAESGVQGFDVVSWYGIFVPAKTPSDIVNKMSADAAKVLADPAINGKLDHLGYTVASSTPAELGKLLKSEVDKWSRVIKDAGISIGSK
ncbi:MAG: Bug family tripartite tricarboxylate transporter substrate binding protein [Xanthobacteraceae bacterium]